MKSVEIFFWIFIFIIFYTYLGYGIVLFFMIQMKRLFSKSKINRVNESYEPDVTLFVTAFNEKDYVEKKVRNSNELEYPKDKLKQIWVTDGSDDGTPEMLAQFPEVVVYHTSERKGKIAAMNRGSLLVETPILVFSDANTMLGKESIRRIVNLFADPKTGCVSGEKRIYSKESDSASGAGEGIYWKYESTLKKWDSELNSVVGAAGELFAVRTVLFEKVEPDTLLDDFIVSLRIAMKGYKIKYDPEAYAIESASKDVKEELKRKIRISAGGIQSVIRLKNLLNPIKFPLLSFQYISHRVLRWTLAPLGLALVFILNLFLVFDKNSSSVYTILMLLQVLFYSAAIIGWILENRSIKVKILFIPYYFFIMNYAVYLGFARFIKGKQSVNWERAKRAD